MWVQCKQRSIYSLSLSNFVTGMSLWIRSIWKLSWKYILHRLPNWSGEKALTLPICQWPNRCCCFLKTGLVFFVVHSMKTRPLWLLHNTFQGCWKQPSYHLIGCVVLRIKKIENMKRYTYLKSKLFYWFAVFNWLE